MDPDLHKDVIAANIALYTSMASEYDSCEPHFRPENQAHVDSILQRITAATSARRVARPRLWNWIRYQFGEKVRWRDRRSRRDASYVGSGRQVRPSAYHSP